MIPYSAQDTNDADRAFPWMNIGLIVVNFLVFFYELVLGTQGATTQDRFFLDYSLVPCEYTGHCTFYPGTPTPFWLTLFTSMFMHAGWLHILGNMLFLWVFGNHIEKAMGHVRYLVFYLVCGLGANALEIITATTSNAPGLGASGAIAGIMGAYLALYPTSRIRTLLPISFVLIPVRLPAWVLIGGWFLIQLLDGLAPGSATAGVAYWAHVGGFLTGLLLVGLFTQPARVEQGRIYHGSVLP